MGHYVGCIAKCVLNPENKKQKELHCLAEFLSLSLCLALFSSITILMMGRGKKRHEEGLQVKRDEKNVLDQNVNGKR
jgi:hypothetical protein